MAECRALQGQTVGMITVSGQRRLGNFESEIFNIFEQFIGLPGSSLDVIINQPEVIISFQQVRMCGKEGIYAIPFSALVVMYEIDAAIGINR